MARVDFSTRTIFLSVRELSNFLTPKYSTLIEYTPTQLNALELGMKWHQKIQEEYKQANQNNISQSFSEVFVSMKLPQNEGWNVILRGRIDILRLDIKHNVTSIIEIKTTSNIDVKDSIDLFWKYQVLFYSYIFQNMDYGALQKQEVFTTFNKSFSLDTFRSAIKSQLIVVQTTKSERTEHIIEYNEKETLDTLTNGILKIIKFFLPRINHFEQFRIIQTIPWFFDEYREGQQQNLNLIRNALFKNPKAMLIGPPGTGKTALTLRILLENAISNDKQIMYTSTKNSQQLEVLHLIKLINVQLQNPIWSVVLLAKEKYCINEKRDENGCDPFNCDFFLSMTKKPVEYYELFSINPIIDSIWLKEKGLETKSFCPYYQAKYMAGFADVIIGDQNYQIDPMVKLGLLKRPAHPLLFSKKGLPYLYLMDEAHNLPARIRDVLSLKIFFDDYASIKAYFKNMSKKYEIFNVFYISLVEILNSFHNLPIVETPSSSMSSALDLLTIDESEDSDYHNRILNLRQKSDEGDFIGINVPEINIFELEQKYISFYNSFVNLDELFYDYPDLRYNKQMIESLELIRQVMDTFTKILSAFKEQSKKNYHCFYYTLEKSKIFELYFLNISDYFQEELKNTTGTIIMSATLHPESFYRVVFGFDEEVSYVNLQNYFPIEHRLTLIVKDIKTRYADLLNIDNLKFIAETVNSIFESKKGRYLFFVPNLELVSQLLGILKLQNKFCFSQFDELSLQTESEGVFVCALGSIFSEGVNLPDLNGVIILSPGIPPPSYKNSLLQEYYKSKTGNGSKEESFNLAFRIPGLNKILQASGRLQRKNEDKGIVFLLGERFGTEYYQSFYPDFLKPIKLVTSSDLKVEINQFWSKFNKK